MPLNILNNEEFSSTIRKIMKTKNVNAMEAIVIHCEEKELDEDIAASLIDADLYGRIHEEAQRLHLIQPEQSLPFDV